MQQDVWDKSTLECNISSHEVRCTLQLQAHPNAFCYTGRDRETQWTDVKHEVSCQKMSMWSTTPGKETIIYSLWWDQYIKASFFMGITRCNHLNTFQKGSGNPRFFSVFKQLHFPQWPLYTLISDNSSIIMKQIWQYHLKEKLNACLI